MARFITLIVAICMGLITASIADRKGYSKKGFYWYGFFVFIPALIHSLLLPNKLDTTKKQYQGKTLGYCVTSVVCLWFLFIFSFYQIIISGQIYRLNLLSNIDMLLSFSMGIVMPILLMVSAMLARKYKYSIVVYAIEAVYAVRGVIYILINLAGLGKGTPTVLTYGYLVADVFTAVAYGMLILFAHKYGVKSEKLAGSGAFLFVIPGFAVLISKLIPIVMMFQLQFYNEIELALQIAQALIAFVAVLFIGLFYQEEAKYNEVDLAEEISA